MADSPFNRGCFRDMSANRPLFRKLDNLLLRVAHLDAAISFYRDRLGHRVLWRSQEAVGFALPDTDADVVAHLNIGPETDILVDDVDEAFAVFLSAGGEARPCNVRSASRLADARAFATPSEMNLFCWISPKARWLATPRAG
jgi:catechol 2,3-dioxygenase-like lactoylglutathione lyase family enzyme